MSISNVTECMFEDDGTLIVRRSQDIQAIIDQNHEESIDAPTMFGEARHRKVGSIPFVIAEQWSRECGAGIGTAEFAEYCKRKIMDGDFAKFRIKGV
jgi:hypothetical protein